MIKHHICCKGILYQLSAGTKCCMDKAYFPRKQICCNNKLIQKRTHGCCAEKSFNKAEKFCCGDEAVPRGAQMERCCGKNKKTYRPDLGEKCCANEKIATADEICCGLNIGNCYGQIIIYIGTF